VNLRAFAKGKPCQIRGPGCNYNAETTVLAHVRLIGISGAGLKSPDLLASWACNNCHTLVDGQSGGSLSKNERDLLLLKGVMRTQAELIRLGLVTW
jgi:Protein of unknown function (DUF1364)